MKQKKKGNATVRACGGIRPLPPIPPIGKREGTHTDELCARQWNRIICAVNEKKTAEEAGLSTETELLHYKNIWSEAEELFAKYGTWPIFSLAELED